MSLIKHPIKEGLFEHHTRLLNAAILDSLIVRLAQGILPNEEVYGSGGHGALVIRGDEQRPFIAITEARQDVIVGSSLKSYRAVPHGDIMLTGCYGLVKACAM